MAHVLEMGKYAAFVWPAYGISAIGIVAAVVLSLRAYAHARSRLRLLDPSAK